MGAGREHPGLSLDSFEGRVLVVEPRLDLADWGEGAEEVIRGTQTRRCGRTAGSLGRWGGGQLCRRDLWVVAGRVVGLGGKLWPDSTWALVVECKVDLVDCRKSVLCGQGKPPG